MFLSSKRKTRQNHQARRLQAESLEHRELLSINLVGTELQVVGTGSADTAQVWESGEVIYAELNGARQHWGSWSVRSVRFTGDAGNDTFTNSTSLPTTAYGDAGNDRITGGTGNDVLDGGDGNDILVGVAGNDTIHGRDGNDSIEGGDGNDTLYGDDGNDSMHGQSGNDSMHGGSGNDTLYGDDGRDYLRGDSGNDYLSGQNGRDRVYGDAGDDTLYGGNDNDSLYGGDGLDTAYGGDGNDTIHGNGGNDTLSGEAGDDRIYGDAGDDRLSGGGGADRLDGDANNDVLLGGDGNDTLHGGSGNDHLCGGAGTDTLDGDSGNDGLFGGMDGNTGDTLQGDTGDDRFLTRSRDTMNDRGSNDVRIRIGDGSSAWTDREIETIDQAFAELQEKTGSTRVLKDTTCSDALLFVKENAASVDYAGLNQWWQTWDWAHAHWDNHRKIHIADWNENDADANWSRRRTAIHEIGHNWDSGDEADHHPGGDGYWADFRDAHDDSDSDDDYARSYGMTNIREDFATCLEAAMDYRTTGFPAAPSAVLNAKLAALDAFLGSFV